MMSFASNISDAQDVQYVSSRSPPAATNSHIRKPPVPPSFSSMQSHHVGHEQAQHPRLPSLPNQLISQSAPKTTRKKGPVPKLYDGECCKSNFVRVKTVVNCIFKSVATKQVDFIIMWFPAKDARAFTGGRFLRQEPSDARALELANVWRRGYFKLLIYPQINWLREMPRLLVCEKGSKTGFLCPESGLLTSKCRQVSLDRLFSAPCFQREGRIKGRVKRQEKYS